jgi:hypothetical protein
MEAGASEQLGALPLHFLLWYKTEDNIKRDCDYIKNGFQMAQDAIVR